MKDKFEELIRIYDDFAAKVEGFYTNAACTRGCAFCCTAAGSIDITTLEGLRIQDAVSGLAKNRRSEIKKALARDIKKRETGRVAPCPFLMKNKACMIYDVRPFACRRIYSLHTCTTDRPPQVSRQYMDIAGQILARLQQLDFNGYAGHISYILHMLEAPLFMATYRAGQFKPDEVVAFGKTHGIVINRMVAGSASGG